MSKKNGLYGVEPVNIDLNFDTYWNYFNMLKEYAINMFEWTGLPETVDPRYLELELFNLGYICFFKDDVTGMNKGINLPQNGKYLALKCTLGGRFNVYNLPTVYHIFTASGYQAERTMKDAVIIYNNYLHQPTSRTIMLFAYRLYNIERTIDINLNQLKHPFVITAPENQILSFKNLWKQVSENDPMIVADAKFDLNQIQAIMTGVKNETISLNDLKHQYMNEALTFLGINNSNTDKKERLITSEVNANNEQLLCSRDVMLNARKEACKQINKMFGLNVDVRFRNEDEMKEAILNALGSEPKSNEPKAGEKSE